ncbi:hypothetical protein GCM10022212_31120 [Actimicrobium antarcticum]|uniref:Uncharacterized protein n=1 Tax=Actimicrobium antarcticum TaxID=1051899 RepID=A0ABP7TSN3_9BURK
MTVVVALCSTVQAQTPSTLVIGVAPHSSARAILDMYQPLRKHLQKSLAVTVDIVTAPDFTEFARRMLHQDYDLAITTGHQARLSQTDAGYLTLLTYRAEFRTIASALTRGWMTTFPSHWILIACMRCWRQYCVRWLESPGLKSAPKIGA